MSLIQSEPHMGPREEASPAEDSFCEGPYCTPVYKDGKQVAVQCPPDCPLCLEVLQDNWADD